MTTYATPEEAIESLLKPELVNGGLDPESYAAVSFYGLN